MKIFDYIKIRKRRYNMTLNEILSETRDLLEKYDKIPRDKSYRDIQENLRKCKIVVEHILKEKCKDDMFLVDISEYFNWIIVRVNSTRFDVEDEILYNDIIKKFKELFIENNLDINISIVLGSIKRDRYFYSMTY